MTYRRTPSQPTDVPRPAFDELVALAAKSRPDWSASQLREVLVGARTAGWSWGRLLIHTARLITDPRGEPADLAAQVRKAQRQLTQQQIETAHRGAAAVRAALHPTEPTDT